MSTGTQIEVLMPQMGVSVSEGTVTRWLKQPGEQIARDEPLLEISTDKVDTEVPSPGEGTLADVRVAEGETVEVGTVLAVIAPAGAVPQTPVEQAPSEQAPSERVSAEDGPGDRVPAPEAGAGPTVAVAPPSPAGPTAPGAPGPGAGNGRSFVSPVVARIASEHGIDPRAVPGTGTGGRVTKRDILGFIETGAGTAAPAAAREPAPEAAAAAPPAPAQPSAAAPPSAPPAPAAGAPPSAGPQPGLQPGEMLEPMTAMRRSIAEHMRRSLDTSAHVTNVSEIDLTRIVALRRRLKPEFEQQGVNLTYLAFIARGVVDTVPDWPWLNAELRGESIVTRTFVNLGIAVSLEGGKGLIVPVIRNAQDLNLLGMARSIQDLAERARTKKLLPEEVQGGTLTITNPGGYGTLLGTPIISQPQVANIGVYAVVKRPVVVTDELGADSLAIRSMMYMTVTYDHRLVDGAYAAQFGRDVKRRLEEWEETT